MPHPPPPTEIARLEGQLAQLTAKQAALRQEAAALQATLTTAAGQDAAASRLAALARVLTSVEGLIGQNQAALAKAQAAERRQRLAALRHQEWDAAEALYRALDLALERLQQLQTVQAQLTALEEPAEGYVPPELPSVLARTQRLARRQQPRRSWSLGAP